MRVPAFCLVLSLFLHGSNAAAEAQISNGVLDSTHDAVGVVVSMTTACTGTLVAPATVLTAAHCVLPPASPPQFFMVGDDYNAPDGVIAVVSYSTDPDYDDMDLSHDFAVLRLASSPPAVMPLPLLVPADDGLTVGASLLLVGFGQTGDGFSNSLRHAGLASIDQLTADFVLTDGPAQGCSGDGGAPALLDINGTESVAGLMAYTDGACPGNTVTVFARISGAWASYLEPALSARAFADGFE